MKRVLIVVTLALSLNGVMGQTYQVSTAAGNGTQGNLNGAASSSELHQPYGVKTDNDSIIYIADTQNHCIRKLNYNTNIVSVLAGTGVAGHSDGVGSSAMFNLPIGVFYSNAFLYVVEATSYIRRIDLNNNNTVSTIAGSGTNGFQDGPASTAKFNNPTSLWVEPNGDVYVVDYFNHCIRLISGGFVSTFAGTPGTAGLANGTLLAAEFNLPRDLVKDSKGNFYIGELGNNVIRKISNGNVTTFSGNGTQASVDGNPTTASFSHPGGICLALQGYFYITDGTGNKIRKMDTLGNVMTIAGNGAAGFADGPGSTAQFSRPEAVTYDVHGSIYIGDPDNERVRKISVPEIGCSLTETITGASTLCSGEGTVLTATGPATSYTWSANVGSLNTSTVNVFPEITTTYTLLSSDSGGCIAFTSFELTVTASPTLSVTGYTTMCTGNSSTLTGHGASSYTWNTGALTIGSPTLNITPNSAATYTLMGSNDGCVDTASVHISLVPFIQAQFEWSLSQCSQTSVNFSNLSSGNVFWEFGDGATDTINNPMHIYASGNYNVSMIANAGTACADTNAQSITLLFPKNPIIPNIFTPNGDDINETLKPIGLNPCEEYNLIIYNRWGQKVFETNSPETEFWNGTIHEKAASADTYFFILSKSGSNKAAAKGHVTLIR